MKFTVTTRKFTVTTARALPVAAALLAAACLSGTASGSVSEEAAESPARVRGTAASSPVAASPQAPSGGGPVAAYEGQRLRWRPCAPAGSGGDGSAPAGSGGDGSAPAGFQCATLKAPLDYAHPARGRVELAVARKRATGPGERLGSLLVNPGGPGGSAVDYLTAYAGEHYPEKVRARYDMVAVDPRGVARSTPVTCLDGPRTERWTRTDLTPDDQADKDELVRSFKDYAAACAEHSGKVLGHVSTTDSARDMDLLRSALGDRRLNYVGASYGTFLGATYAGLFPGRSGRLVLDGATDPSLDALRVNLDQTAGFETAFRSFAEDCATRADCPLGRGGPEAAGRRLKAFFDRLDEKPLHTSQTGRDLSEAQGTTGVIAAMYNEAAWPLLRKALTRAVGHGDGSTLLTMSDAYYERDDKGAYSNLMAANAAVNCLDLPPAFSGPEAVEAALPDFEKASPAFGESMAWAALNCTYWPVRATGKSQRITAQGAPPILVVGTTRDPATPYRWARSLAAQLGSGVLLTYEGDGHTAYGRGSTCVDTHVTTYLLTGRAPQQNTRCS
ncbi:alpha/beta hydrolase [Streptomyces sp. NPDC049954]|uniref:alpha/beta hydrolase n=1 Tax=Streptomyces sp. NPDC049954 TaxID=3155779 RepID=UPI003437737E